MTVTDAVRLILFFDISSDVVRCLARFVIRVFLTTARIGISTGFHHDEAGGKLE